MDPLTPLASDEVPAPRAAADRLSGRDFQELAGWILAAILGMLVAGQFFFAAFPEAAMDLRVSRDEAEEIAREFVHQYVNPVSADHPLEAYERTKVFRIEEDNNGGGPKLYLERELGLTEANQLMAGSVSVWFWEIRYFRPQQQEEFRVRVSPTGRIVGYFHVIEEARESARLAQEPARAIAEEFARQRVHAPLDEYDWLPAEANATDRPQRRDWKFTWERRNFKAKDAPYQIEVTLHGDRVGGYREFLKVPETWTREFARLRSTNLFYQFAAQVPYMLLMGAVLLVLFELSRKRLVPWGGALRLGLLLAALYFLMNVNQWPLTRAGYDTNSSYGGFVLDQFTSAAILSLTLGALVAFSVAAGEPLYRLQKPDALQLGALFRRRGWLDALRSKEFFKAAVIGLCLAAAHIGFVVAFYLAGRRFGFWSPQEVRYTDAISTLAPWLFPLAISVFAATSEEFLFRLFAIPLLLRMTKSKVIAIVVPAFIWGFLHSAYPQQPGYVRGLEVGMIGMVAGWVMLRWGILATLVWHYTVDALLIGLFLLRAEGLYYRISGTFVVALAVFPFLAALGLLAWHRRFAVNDALLNQALPLVAPDKAEEETPEAATDGAASYQVLSPALRKWVLLAAGGCAAILLLPKAETIGNFEHFSITASEAGALADQILRARKADPASYHRVVTLLNDYPGNTVEFLRRELGVQATNEFYRHRLPAAFWRIRYFRDSEKEELQVVLLPNGTFHALHHPLDERSEGPNLTKEEAQARAEAWLQEDRGVDLNQWKLVEAKSEKQPKRTDHDFEWEEIAPLVGPGTSTPPEGAAHVRIALRVQGDEVSGYRKFVKLPEEWERRHTEDTLGRTIYSVGRILLLAGAAVWALVIFFTHLRRYPVPWARMSRWALWAALAVVLNVANSFPKLLLAYTTEWPLKMFVVITALGVFFSLAVVYGGAYLLLAFGWFFVSRSFGEAQIPGWRGMPRAYYRDGLLLGISGVSILMVLFGRLPAWANQLFPTWKQFIAVAVPTELDTFVPAAGELAGAIPFAFLVAGGVALCGGFIGQWRSSAAKKALFFAAMVVLLAGSPANAADFAKNAVVSAVQLGCCWLLVTRVARFNLLGYFLTAAILPLVSATVALARQPVFYYQINAGLCALCIAALLAMAYRLSTSASDQGNQTS